MPHENQTPAKACVKQLLAFWLASAYRFSLEQYPMLDRNSLFHITVRDANTPGQRCDPRAIARPPRSSATRFSLAAFQARIAFLNSAAESLAFLPSCPRGQNLALKQIAAGRTSLRCRGVLLCPRRQRQNTQAPHSLQVWYYCRKQRSKKGKLWCSA